MGPNYKTALVALLLPLCAVGGIQTLPTPILFPEPLDDATTVPTLSLVTLDAAGESLAMVVRADRTAVITNILLRTQTVTVGGTADVRVETVNTSTGDPSGTLFSTTSNGALVIADTDDNLWLKATLTLGASVTAGDLYAIVIVAPSGMNANFIRFDDMQANLPYSDAYLSAAWTKSWSPCAFLVQYTDGTYAYNRSAPWTVQTTTFSSSSTPDERGVYFTLPVPVRVDGAWVWLDADGDFDVRLYDSDGSTVLLSQSQDADIDATVNGDLYYLPFSTTTDLAAATAYRLTILPTTTTSLSLYELLTPGAEAAEMQAVSGGTNFIMTTRTDAGSWTQVATNRPWMGLSIIGFSDGAGGGGTVAHSYAY